MKMGLDGSINNLEKNDELPEIGIAENDSGPLFVSEHAKQNNKLIFKHFSDKHGIDYVREQVLPT